MDASLDELSDLIRDVVPAARGSRARLDFLLVYPDKTGRLKLKKLGQVNNARPTPEASLTLKQLDFQIGDYLDIAIYT